MNFLQDLNFRFRVWWHKRDVSFTTGEYWTISYPDPYGHRYQVDIGWGYLDEEISHLEKCPLGEPYAIRVDGQWEISLIHPLLVPTILEQMKLASQAYNRLAPPDPEGDPEFTITRGETWSFSCKDIDGRDLINIFCSWGDLSQLAKNLEEADPNKPYAHHGIEEKKDGKESKVILILDGKMAKALGEVAARDADAYERLKARGVREITKTLVTPEPIPEVVESKSDDNQLPLVSVEENKLIVR